MRKKIIHDRTNGRPAAEIDWARVDHLLEAGCTGTSVAAAIGMHADTLYHAIEKRYGVGFSAYAQQKKATGNDKILAKQFDVALEGDKTMLMFLGKVRCGQQETQSHEVKMKVEDLSLNGRLTKEQAAQLLEDIECIEDE